eukprot:7579913-Pyramimonas_sp.AAC.1
MALARVGAGTVSNFSLKGRQWFLDGHRKHPALGAKRAQFMITPALAITAHAAQGGRWAQ